ncbi:PREDICTED: kinesin-like protein KIN-10C isoform X2 [Tarenaya hassleriana]|uniref:kinesin-like protein KIN-10C isoform X2 n=1 Tax=Tarenaya hassleriana TaxID=28532 RepID=UPI00053C1968|nr:PREDICTED: kinesin-like protein KIN-10C isoform X2 [Tarenaya hassleriana]
MEAKVMSQGQKVVRVVARVRPATQLVSGSSVTGDTMRSVSVHKPMGEESEMVSISFGDPSASSKDSYKLDNCYEGDESMGLIITREIKPLISEVFDGRDATVIAYGARSSGKTHLIQGSDAEHGLAVIAMADIISMARERGDSISISLYEVSQENVYDLLHPEKPTVSVLEAANGKVQLKGLSQVSVKSILEFQNLYYGGKKLHNASQKLISEPAHRSHKGLMIRVSPQNATLGSRGKMNFLDLAGYEDPRKQNSDGQAPLEITRINKSIYAFQNVMYALNANECHVPYRESKLARMLKDSLQGCNRTLLITCLAPAFSQDSVYMLSLASRISLGSNRTMMTSTKNINSSAKSNVSSLQRIKTPLTVSATAKKQTGLRGNLSERKTKVNTVASAMKARRLFGEASGSVKSKKASKEISSLEVTSNIQASILEEEISSLNIASDVQSSLPEEENSALAFSSSPIIINAECSTIESCSSGTIDRVDKETPEKLEEGSVGTSPCTGIATPGKGEMLDKENNIALLNRATSPPLSLRLRELSNTLKSICKTSNPPCTEALEKNQGSPIKLQTKEGSENSDNTSEAVVSVELKTPERSMASNIGYSPWKTFSAHSSKVKNSVVEEYLKFLNTAEKDDLKKLKGIGEKRAGYIVELREESPEPFKTLDDLKDIGLSAKQIKGMLKKEVGDIFN